MAGLVAQEGCFRQILIGYFEGAKKVSRRSLSTRLLEWIFAEPATGGKNVVCCDVCCHDVIKQWGEIGFVSKVFGLRLSPAYSESAGHRQSETGHRQIGIAAFIGGAAILSIVMLLVFSRGKAPTLQNHKPSLTHLFTPTRPPLSLRCKVPTSRIRRPAISWQHKIDFSN